jgi:O-acetyl-ADP-ribose deacetylase (regulator of RNase III)
MNITVSRGNIFDSKMQTLTIPVNTVGVMGKGLALELKRNYYDAFVAYSNMCADGVLKIGKPCVYRRTQLPWFLMFPTKDDWRNPSKLEYIELGMRWLHENYKREGIRSIAIPALGCGLGGLNWEDVGAIIVAYASKMDIPVEIYIPTHR